MWIGSSAALTLAALAGFSRAGEVPVVGVNIYHGHVELNSDLQEARGPGTASVAKDDPGYARSSASADWNGGRPHFEAALTVEKGLAHAAFNAQALGSFDGAGLRTAPTFARYQFQVEGHFAGNGIVYSGIGMDNGFAGYVHGDSGRLSGEGSHALNELVKNGDGVRGVVALDMPVYQADGQLHLLFDLTGGLDSGRYFVPGPDDSGKLFVDLAAIVFPELEGASAEALGLAIDWSRIDAPNALDPRARWPRESEFPVPSEGGGRVPEPASFAVWAAAILFGVRRGRRHP